ncbi:MAG: nucleotidyltransferase domain-containing protein, partial [Candidatus Solibacter usitatus]|nr:nucleotidyltransferase domain-containing protein [Candidatus Solibacter usitatus]
MTIVANPHSSPGGGLETWDNVRAQFFETGDPERVLAWRTSAVDSLVLDACHQDLPAGPGLAVVAVGGYGRRQLFPYSDVDLLLLFDSEKAIQQADKVVAPFLQRLWDARLRVSQSVRTLAECTELHDGNVELNVSLLDLRYLAGDPQLFHKLSERLPRFVQGQRQSLMRNLARLTRERHHKHGDTLYHLEPNIKEAPGGLRDLQVLSWLHQIKGADPKRLGSRPDSADLDAAGRFFFAVRCYLHYHHGRDANSLTFDAQEWIADQAGPLDAAAWMRGYFRHARSISLTTARLVEECEAQSSSLFSQFRDWRSRLSNAELSVLRERVHFKVPRQLEQDPAMSLRLFAFVARHGIRLAPEAEQRIEGNLAVLRSHFSQPLPLWAALKEIFSLPHAVLAL